MRRIVALAAAVALGLTACGGSTNDSSSSGGKAPESAQFAPATTAFFVSVNTDFNGTQWQKANALLDKFPGRDKLVQQLESELAKEKVDFERDVKPAVGPEVGVAGLELTDNPPVVVYTKSPDPAKLKALLAKGDDKPVVTSQVEGWTVAAETQAALDRFESARKEGSLADSSEFKDAVASVAADPGVLFYVAGSGIQKAVDQGLRESGAPQGLSEKFGTVRSLVGTLSAEDEGVRFDEATAFADDLGLRTYSPALDEAVPAKPLLFLSVSSLDTLTRKGLDAAEKSIPNFANQRAQFEKAFGFSIENDVLPLLHGEVAVAVYGAASSGVIPVTVDVVVAVDDEAKARQLMEKVGALLELGDTGTVTKVQVGGTQATELRFTGEGFSLFWLVADGKLEISTSRAGLEALRASTPRLADDDAYTSALDAAGAPDKVVGLLYSDLQTAIPFFVSLDGSSVDAETRANLKPLKAAVATASEDGKTLHASGFLAIG
jgi:uncharacterized protein DUF3352